MRQMQVSCPDGRATGLDDLHVELLGATCAQRVWAASSMVLLSRGEAAKRCRFPTKAAQRMRWVNVLSIAVVPKAYTRVARSAFVQCLHLTTVTAQQCGEGGLHSVPTHKKSARSSRRQRPLRRVHQFFSVTCRRRSAVRWRPKQRGKQLRKIFTRPSWMVGVPLCETEERRCELTTLGVHSVSWALCGTCMWRKGLWSCARLISMFTI